MNVGLGEGLKGRYPMCPCRLVKGVRFLWGGRTQVRAAMPRRLFAGAANCASRRSQEVIGRTSPLRRNGSGMLERVYSRIRFCTRWSSSPKRVSISYNLAACTRRHPCPSNAKCKFQSHQEARYQSTQDSSPTLLQRPPTPRA